MAHARLVRSAALLNEVGVVEPSRGQIILANHEIQRARVAAADAGVAIAVELEQQPPVGRA